MKKTLSFFLAFAFLFCCSPHHVVAVDSGGSIEEEIISDGLSSTQADELFAIRAQLAQDYENNIAEIEKIDAQLLALGLEIIPGEEVAEKLGVSANPLMDYTSNSDIRWYSERLIVSWYGQRYEIQVITGTPASLSSSLCTKSSGYRNDSSGKAVSLFNALQVLSNNIVTASASELAPQVGATLSVATTLYDILKAYNSSLSPYSASPNGEYSFSISMSTTLRYAFIKYEGQIDSGNQILGYVGNSVEFAVGINIPYFEEVNGSVIPIVIQKNYSDTVESGLFDTHRCKWVAAQNFWDYKQGVSNFVVYHDIIRVPIVLIDETYYMNPPFAAP